MAKTSKHEKETPEKEFDDVENRDDGTLDGEDSAEETPVEPSSEERVTELEEKVAELEDRALRARAEVENIQRRAAREVENARKFGVERLVRDLVPVIDSLERAAELAEASSDEGKDSEGIALATRLMLDTLAGHGVERIAPEGEPFNPEWHEAVAMAPSETSEENSVLKVVQAGLSLNGRLVRAAKVVVSRAAEK